MKYCKILFLAVLAILIIFLVIYFSRDYNVNLAKYGIKNDGSNPTGNSIGINLALKFAEENGCHRVIMPRGEYCISESNPIRMVDNITLDLNGSTLKINPNGQPKYALVDFTGCKNAKLINGTLLGDRNNHDYNSIKGTHERACGVVFNDCEKCSISKITVKQFPGYGIYTSLGKNISNLVIGVTNDNLQNGGISKDGKTDSYKGNIRTIKPIEISKAGGEFEIGYNKGYMGYPFMMAKTYDAYFYDGNMKYVSCSLMCKQYKKVCVPKNAKYVHFVFHQSAIPSSGDTDFKNSTVFVTNYKSPHEIQISNCLIQQNRCLGIGICGGRSIVIENNTFSNNGGAEPGYAVDIEDGWEYTDGLQFKKNKFINNANDIAACSGDNIMFQKNEFSSTVYMWPRATNYKFINNKFSNIKLNVNYGYSTDTLCRGNTYINCSIATSNEGKNCKIAISKEKLINTSVESLGKGDILYNSTITSDVSSAPVLKGIFNNCLFKCIKAYSCSSTYTKCNIQDTGISWQGNLNFNNCKFSNSLCSSHSIDGTLKADNCNFINSGILINTWGQMCGIDIENCNIKMNSGKKSFLDISAGKMADLVFNKNIVNDSIAKPVFNMYDSDYSLPEGNAVINENTFKLNSYGYVFDGVDISKGSVKLTDKNNKIEGAEFINKKYKNNKYFLISNN